MELEVKSRETIKPSNPTPPHLRTYSLSFIDQMLGTDYVPLIFFYDPKYKTNGCADPQEIINILRISLSSVLPLYYPLAGRINQDTASIDCNDHGVLFLEASVKHKLKEVLQNPWKSEFLDALFPDDLQWKQMENLGASLLAIQVNLFDCGGIAIGVCMSHKFGDAFTMTNFISDWAIIARKNHFDKEALSRPVLDAASVFPGDGFHLSGRPVGVVYEKGSHLKHKRLVFEGSKISALKAMVSAKVPNPTRVEVVAALIYKCAISALRSNSGSVKQTTLVQTLNLRSRMVPSVPENSTGNMIWNFKTPNFLSNGQVELHVVVSDMEKALAQFCNAYAKKFKRARVALTHF